MLSRFQNYALDLTAGRVKSIDATTAWDTHMEFDQVRGKELAPAEAAVVIEQWRQGNQTATQDPHLER